MVVTLNMGFDRGNCRTNAVAIADGGRFVEIDASSMVAEGDLKRYQLVKTGSGGFEGASLSDMVVEYEGLVYFLSDLAHQGKNPTTGFGDKNRYHGKHTKIAIMAYAAMLAAKRWHPVLPTEFAVNLVMGVPFRAYQDESERIVQELSHSYRFTLNGRDTLIHIDTVKVFMEGAGAAIYRGFDASQTIGIVDSGSLTTNILRFDGARAHAEQCDSFEIGIATALDRLNTRFEHKYDRDLEEGERQQVLLASIGSAEWPELFADGEPVSMLDLRTWMREAIQETGQDKNSRIARVWSNQRGKVAAGFKSVYHVGGGAYYFHPSLQSIIKSADLLPDAERANSRGFAVLAEQIAQRKASLRRA